MKFLVCFYPTQTFNRFPLLLLPKTVPLEGSVRISKELVIIICINISTSLAGRVSAHRTASSHKFAAVSIVLGLRFKPMDDAVAMELMLQ